MQSVSVTMNVTDEIVSLDSHEDFFPYEWAYHGLETAAACVRRVLPPCTPLTKAGLIETRSPPDAGPSLPDVRHAVRKAARPCPGRAPFGPLRSAVGFPKPSRRRQN